MRHEAHLQAIENSMLNEQTDVERKAIIYHCDQIRRSRMFLEKRLERIEKKLRRFEKETLTPNGMQLIGLNQKAA